MSGSRRPTGQTVNIGRRQCGRNAMQQHSHMAAWLGSIVESHRQSMGVSAASGEGQPTEGVGWGVHE